VTDNIVMNIHYLGLGRKATISDKCDYFIPKSAAELSD